MKHRIDIRGNLIPNDYKWFYDWFEEDSTCPRDVQKVLDQAVEGDEIEVYISSPGGVIEVGTEIYTALRSAKNVKIYITGRACSAASIVAMAAYCEMAPTALMMVHCVSTQASGNHNDMEHTAEVLRTADQALCRAYMQKAGMTEEEALNMMNHETWMTAEQAKERGLIDGVMFEEKEEPGYMVAGEDFHLPSEEKMNQVRKMMKGKTDTENTAAILMQAQTELLKLKGETR